MAGMCQKVAGMPSRKDKKAGATIKFMGKWQQIMDDKEAAYR